jgi:hypothetical protein
MSSDDGFSVRGIALALERPQAAADHGEKVVDVVDDELRHLRYRPPPLLPARGDRATRVGPRASVAQNPRYLAVGPDERDLHAPGRNDAATAIADAPHPCAGRTLHSKRNGRRCPRVRRHPPLAGFLQNRGTKRRLSHVGPPGLRSFNGTPTSAPYTRAGDDGLQIEFKAVERKITSRHGVDRRPLSEQLRCA